RLECGFALRLVPGRVWCRVECGGASLLVPPRVWWRVASGAASSVVARRFWCRLECGAASRLGRIECGVGGGISPSKAPELHTRCARPQWGHAAAGPRRGGATPRRDWPRRRGATSRPDWPRRGGPRRALLRQGRPAPTRPGYGRAGAQPAWLRRVWLRSGRPGSCETVLPHLSEQRSDLRVPCGVALQELATQHGGAHQRVGRETLPGGLAR